MLFVSSVTHFNYFWINAKTNFYFIVRDMTSWFRFWYSVYSFGCTCTLQQPHLIWNIFSNFPSSVMTCGAQISCVSLQGNWPGAKVAPSLCLSTQVVSVFLTDCVDSGSYHGPRWRMEPADLFIPVESIEEEATLTCDAKGTPPPQYR